MKEWWRRRESKDRSVTTSGDDSRALPTTYAYRDDESRALAIAKLSHDVTRAVVDGDLELARRLGNELRALETALSTIGIHSKYLRKT